MVGIMCYNNSAFLVEISRTEMLRAGALILDLHGNRERRNSNAGEGMRARFTMAKSKAVASRTIVGPVSGVA